MLRIMLSGNGMNRQDRGTELLGEEQNVTMDLAEPRSFRERPRRARQERVRSLDSASENLPHRVCSTAGYA